MMPEEVRGIALRACLWGNGRRFDLHGVVVMPDHVHLVFTPLRDADSTFSVNEIMQGIKGASVHQINQVLQRKGQVWQHESFDHVLRQEEAILAKVDYVIQNPIRAGLVNALCEYPWLWVSPQLHPLLM